MALEHKSADFSDLASTRQTFEFGKRTFVSGLFWQPLPGSTAKLRKTELRKMSEEQGFDLAIQRTSGVPQVGFAATSEGVKAGMLSVAAMVSKSLEVANRDRSFLCAIQAPNGLWIYVAQREGVLLHDGDLLASEDTVRNRMMTDLSLTEWQTVFAPDHWGISGSLERRFEDLLPRSGEKYSFKKWWEIRPVRNTWADIIQDNQMLYIALALLLAAMAGYYFWSKYQTQKQLEELARLEAEEQIARESVKEEQPWKKRPAAQQFLTACTTAIGSIKTFWPGNWDPARLHCEGQTLTAQWIRRETGTVEQLLSFEPQATFTLDGNQATLEIPLEMGPPKNTDVLPGARERTLALIAASQRYGIGLMLEDPQATRALGEPAPSESWKTLNWTLAGTHLAPATLIPHIDGEGFRITQIKLTFEEGGTMTWTMEGNQYVQP